MKTKKSHNVNSMAREINMPKFLLLIKNLKIGLRKIDSEFARRSFMRTRLSCPKKFQIEDSCKCDLKHFRELFMNV